MMPDLEDLMRQVSAGTKTAAAREIMSLGEFIAALEAVDRKDAEVRMDFSYRGPGNLDSYRGSRYAVGDAIKFWPGPREGNPTHEGNIRFAADVMGGHTPVVWVEGKGAIALSHVGGPA